MPVLTVIDTTGIQNYIFGSNILRENVGASEIVARATTEWVFDILRDKKWKTNLKDKDDAENKWRNPFEAILAEKKIEADDLDAEAIYAGGGNTLILFAAPEKSTASAEEIKQLELEKAKEFTRCYTRSLLKRAPGLEVVIAHSDSFNMKDVEGGKAIMPRLLENTMERVNHKKANRPLNAQLLGMSVTAPCHSTGKAATHDPLDLATGTTQQDENFREVLREKYRGNHVSSEVYAKLQMSLEANARLKAELFGKIEGWDKVGLKIPFDFDDLGRTLGEASFIAIVHTDGNGMGNRVKEHGKNAKDNREWIGLMRELSRSIYEANRDSLKEMIGLLLRSLRPAEEGWNMRDKFGQSFALPKNVKTLKNKKLVETFFPLRPLIFGGEDVAFVCDGRLGVALAAYYLRRMEEKKLADKQKAYSRAGIAIVKSHYPFARAYSLAADLADSAKERIKQLDKDKPKDQQGRISALDWHIALTGISGRIREIRKREYEIKIRGDKTLKQLAMRPLSFQAKGSDDWHTWEDFRTVIEYFQNPEHEWTERRNKLKGLREALRGGQEVAADYIHLYQLNKGEHPLPEMPHCKLINQSGWFNEHCGYFDAIEAMDLFFALEEAKADETGAKGTA